VGLPRESKIYKHSTQVFNGEMTDLPGERGLW
jgi:hypothetical protein